MKRASAALVILGAAFALGFVLHAERGREASFAWLAGLAFGALLQRSRFCFASAFRDVFLLREARAALGVIAALVAGSIGYAVVFGAQVPDPSAGWVPPTAFISRVGWHTLLGGVAFGAGMVLARGCISGNLFRLGEGALSALTALAGAIVGFALAQRAWNALWVGTISTAPVVWLPKNLGYAGALALQLGLLAGIAWLLLKRAPQSATPQAPTSLARRAFVDAWPAWAGGLAIGALAVLALFRGSPLGVTAELSRTAWSVGRALEWLPERLEGIDTIAGCTPRADASGLTNNGLFVAALVCGSLCAAVGAGEFRLRGARPRAHLGALTGGILLGFGAMIASGCTVGALLSGTMAFSLHGWVFALGLVGGAWLATRMSAKQAAPSGVVDVRGETCPVPSLRLQEFLASNPSRAPFTVVGDHLPSMESMRHVAERAGWACEFAQRADGAWVASLSPRTDRRTGSSDESEPG